MRLLFLIVMILHSLIHLLGYRYNPNPVKHPTRSQIMGALWLSSALVMLGTALLYYLNYDWWWILSIVAILISQYLIVLTWRDARYGTIANILILLVTITGFAGWNFRQLFEREVSENLKIAVPDQSFLLTETDLLPLPEPVQRYLRYTNSVGKPKVKSFRVEFSGTLRNKTDSRWMPFTSVQYNFMNSSTRLFFLNATMKGLPVGGLHTYKDGYAAMDIRLLNLYRVQYQTGREMSIAETVTFFNDMCCLAPATLIDPRIEWLEADENRVRARFTNNSISVYAWLYFNDQGELTDFISEDRYALMEDGAMKQLRWSTPLQDYKSFSGYRLAGYAEAIYRYPTGNFTYGEFRMRNIEYNSKE